VSKQVDNTQSSSHCGWWERQSNSHKEPTTTTRWIDNYYKSATLLRVLHATTTKC